MSNHDRSPEQRADPLEAAIHRGAIESEFGWGTGLTPRKFRDKDPSEGDRYQARVHEELVCARLAAQDFSETCVTG